MTDMTDKAPIVGIDLGTSKCRIAAWKDGKIQIIPDPRTKNNFIPSYVTFPGNKEIYIGERAKKELSKNPRNTLFDVKHLIGAAKGDLTLPRNRYHWPFRVSHSSGRAMVEVDRDERKKYSPGVIMACLLKLVIENANDFLGLKVTRAVMTVPSYYNETQRQQAKDVADIAKVSLIHVIDDCVAVALAYCFEKELTDVDHMLVYDLGMYSFQVSVLKVKDGYPEVVVCESNNSTMGSRKLDLCLVKHCVKKNLREPQPGLNNDTEAPWKLLPACEEAKEILSCVTETNVKTSDHWPGCNFICEISRQQFEDMCTDMINETLNVVECALRKAEIDKGKIEHVVLVGGSTRIPKLREMVKNFFNLKDLDQSIDPEELIVNGAALAGIFLSRNSQEGSAGKVCWSLKNMETEAGHSSSGENDVVQVGKNQNEVLVGRSTRIPSKVSEMVRDHFQRRELDQSIPPEEVVYGAAVYGTIKPHEISGLSGTATGPVGDGDEGQANEEHEGRSDMSKEGPAVGIDLGTTCSCIAVWKDGSAKILFNEDGNLVTPSYVAFTEHERLVGDSAKKQMVVSPENIVYDSKRLIGRTGDDQDIKNDMKSWSFQLVTGTDKLGVEVQYQRVRKRFYPEQISAMVLANLKETAETHLRTKVTDAVVTVPAYFNDAQRQATKDAAQIAGLNVLRIINEPTAAAIPYGLENNSEEERTVLVYDLGGGTFDVTILSVKGLTFTVMSTSGDTHLGGRDFDNQMVDFHVDMLKRKHKKDITGNHRAMQRLRVACEEAKQVLSNRMQTEVIVDNIFDGIDLKSKISRQRFEDLCLTLFQKTLGIVQKALSDAKVEKKDIDDVVLVGGSTRIPRIQAMVKDFFNGKEICKNVNPDHAVAMGAAVQAAVLHGDHEGHLISEVVLEDVLPMSLGVEVEGHAMRVILKKNSKIPCINSSLFTMAESSVQHAIFIRVLEIEDYEAKKSNLLASFNLGRFLSGTGVPKPTVIVTFYVDENGILNVTGAETARGQTKNMNINRSKGGFSQEEIDRMKLEEQILKEGERRMKEQTAARSELESYVYSIKEELESSSDAVKSISEKQKNLLIEKCETLLDWIEENQNADKEVYEKKQSDLKREWMSKNF